MIDSSTTETAFSTIASMETPSASLALKLSFSPSVFFTDFFFSTGFLATDSDTASPVLSCSVTLPTYSAKEANEGLALNLRKGIVLRNALLRAVAAALARDVPMLSIPMVPAAMSAFSSTNSSSTASFALSLCLSRILWYLFLSSPSSVLRLGIAALTNLAMYSGSTSAATACSPSWNPVLLIAAGKRTWMEPSPSL